MSRQTNDPCPACGRLIEVDQIEVTSWADGPDNPQFIDGRSFCPSGCDPRFRRIVLAPNAQVFGSICADNRWNPRRVIYVNSEDPNRAVQALRGMSIRPDMVTLFREVHPEIWDMIRMGVERGNGDARSLPFPPVPVVESLPWSGPMIPSATWDAAVTEPEPAADFSPARMARAIDEAIRHNASILERHRTEEDPFYWGDAMQWTGDHQ
jgi:hypothetical protein